MSDTQTTFEEAQRCPKCELPGEDTGTTPVRSQRGQQVQVHTIYCRNAECKWYNTSWIVQVNPDGTIPVAYSQLGNKKYPQLSPETQTRVEEAIKAQVAAETSPGGAEVRNPHG